MRVVALAIEEAHVVAGDERQAAGRGCVQGEGVERILAVALGAGDFKVQVFAETALQVGQMLFGMFVAPTRSEPTCIAVAAGDGEQAFAVVAQPFRT